MGALRGLRVIEAADGIAGGYAGKLLVDMGAEVTKVEPPGGDPLRRWSAAHPDRPVADTGPLFSYLAAGKASTAHVDLGWADVVVAGPGADGLLGVGWQARCREDATVVSISSFGEDGPLAGRPATEFTLQAWCGLISACGTADAPLQMGAGVGQWATGATAALAALAGHRAGGAAVEVSALEVMAVCLNNYPTLYRLFTGQPAALSRGGDWLSVVRCKDGWIGLCIFTAQQWADFAAMIGRPDLSEDERLISMGARSRNRAFSESVVRPWLAEHTVEEIHELGGLFRVPVALVGNGEVVFQMAHLNERGVFVTHPAGFAQPRPPFQLSATPALALRPAPALHSGTGASPSPATGRTRNRQPLGGVRVLDFTAFWSGPYATHLLATLGADVIKVEGPTRPDGMRFATVASPDDDNWLELGPTFHAANPAKRSVAIDFTITSGRELLLELAKTADVVVENFTPRVLNGVRLDYDALRAVNPSLVMLRIPGFGLDGPWANRSGFAQTMEQISGIGWLTGLPDGDPLVRSTIDPISGIHGAFAVLAALAHREATGEGQLIEMPMVEVALNVAGESIVTWSAEGVCLHRDGNRGPWAAPQGVYPTAGTGDWVALAASTDEQWDALVALAGRPDWVGLDRAQRRAMRDEIDGVLVAWLAPRSRDETVEALLDAGIPAAPVWDQNFQDTLPQLIARRFNQSLQHPVAGEVPTPGTGMSSEDLDIAYRAAAPTVGQHTGEVLRTLLNLDDDQLTQLHNEGAIGPT